MENYKDLLKEGFQLVVTSQTYDEAVISKYFSKSYIQIVDGKKLDYNGFCEHMKVQKVALKSVAIDFTTIIQEECILFTNHLVHVVTKEDRRATLQVIAEFHIKDNKVQYCSELTHMISGDQRERDLGTRQ
jgi:hypothetical protein